MTNLEARRPGGIVGLAPPVGEIPTDGDLLARWSAGTDPSALEQLIRRHGGMVLGVCRRLLGDTPDAEDAFQATFLVLVRKAAALARPEQVAGWLHGVALRVAHKARAQRARRREREVTIVDPVAPTPPDDTSELRRVLDEELDRLPEKYRLPIVLCELEGRTIDEAARLLGWPKGTVAGRLSRGRELLRQRLSRRRGLALPLFLAGGIAPGTVGTVATEPPEPLVSATLQTAAGSPAARPAALSEGVVWRRGRTGLLLLLFLTTGALATGTWVIAATLTNPPVDPVPGRSSPAQPAPGQPSTPIAPAGSCHPHG
jgi:RNA polymerase sigma factor (sigma-70 family)